VIRRIAGAALFFTGWGFAMLIVWMGRADSDAGWSATIALTFSIVAWLVVVIVGTYGLGKKAGARPISETWPNAKPNTPPNMPKTGPYPREWLSEITFTSLDSTEVTTRLIRMDNRVPLIRLTLSRGTEQNSIRSVPLNPAGARTLADALLAFLDETTEKDGR
jgi:hypothetical protein